MRIILNFIFISILVCYKYAWCPMNAFHSLNTSSLRVPKRTVRSSSCWIWFESAWQVPGPRAGLTLDAAGQRSATPRMWQKHLSSALRQLWASQAQDSRYDIFILYGQLMIFPLFGCGYEASSAYRVYTDSLSSLDLFEQFEDTVLNDW